MFISKYLFFILIYLCIAQKRLLNKQKKTINVVFAINNDYINYLIGCLISLLDHSDKNSVYEIYAQVSDSFKDTNLCLIYGLEKKYFNCFIHIINMGNEYHKYISTNIDTSTYYRLKLPVLLPSKRRIIHIDADSTILNDLMELYTLNFNDKYILGRLDMLVEELDSLGIYTKNYINCGVLLMDLYSLRKYNYVEKFNDYLNNHNNDKYLNHHDQTVINYVCKDKIGILSPKFHMWPFKHNYDIIEFNNKLMTKYDIKDFIKDFEEPYIVHFPGHFKKNENKKSSFFYELFDKYLNKANDYAKQANC